jgi:hypothetical protein
MTASSRWKPAAVMLSQLSLLPSSSSFEIRERLMTTIEQEGIFNQTTSSRLRKSQSADELLSKPKPNRIASDVAVFNGFFVPDPNRPIPNREDPSCLF